MKLFDFSLYAKRRDLSNIARRVNTIKSQLNEPGALQEMKDAVAVWFELHQEAAKTKNAA